MPGLKLMGLLWKVAAVALAARWLFGFDSGEPLVLRAEATGRVLGPSLADYIDQLVTAPGTPELVMAIGAVIACIGVVQIIRS